jgi:hypothetical protein
MAYRDILALRPFATPAVALGATCLFVHFAANNQYDVFRDELYFIVRGERPGIVAQTPLE